MATPEELKAEILKKQIAAKQAAAQGKASAPVAIPPREPTDAELRREEHFKNPEPLPFNIPYPDWMLKVDKAVLPYADASEQLVLGTLMGFGDETFAGATALGKLFRGEEDDFGLAYDEALVKERAKEIEYEQQHPVLAPTMKIAGGLATLPLTMGAGAAGTAGNAARVTAGQAALQAGKAGALYGGVQGFGEGEGGLANRLKSALVGGGTGAALGGVLGAASPAVTGFIRRIFGGLTNEAMQRTASNVGAMEASGMTPSLLAATVSKPAAWAAKGAATAPLIGDLVESSARQSLREGSDATNRLASTFGDAIGGREAGEAAQAGMTAFQGTKPLPGAMSVTDAQRIASRPTGASSFKEKETALYTLTEAALQQNFRHRPRETVIALGHLTNKIRSNPELSAALETPQLRQFYEALTGPNGQRGMTFNELQTFRTAVGEGIKDRTLFPGIDQQDLRLLWGALSRDLDNAVQHGDLTGRATQLWNRANKYAEAGRSQFEKLDRLTGATGEETFGRLVAAAQSGVGKGNLNMLRAARRSMSDEAWNDVSAGLIREMGLETKGAALGAERVFSPTTFMTNYAALSREAKEYLFGSGSQRQALETLAQVFGNQKFTAKLANTSNTANVAQGAGWIMGGFANLPVALKAYGGAAVVAKLMTSPAFARWVAAGARATTPAARAAHLRRLNGIGGSIGLTAAQIEAMAGAFAGSGGMNQEGTIAPATNEPVIDIRAPQQ